MYQVSVCSFRAVQLTQEHRELTTISTEAHQTGNELSGALRRVEAARTVLEAAHARLQTIITSLGAASATFQRIERLARHRQLTLIHG